MELNACAAPGCGRERAEAGRGYCARHAREVARGGSAAASQQRKPRRRSKTPRGGVRASPRPAALAEELSAAPDRGGKPPSRGGGGVKVGRRRRPSVGRSRRTARKGATPTAGRKKQPRSRSRRKSGSSRSATAAPPRTSGGEAEEEEEVVEEEEDGEEEDHFECGACGEAFLHGTPYVTAFGKGFHAACFCCTECASELGGVDEETGETAPVYGNDGEPFCEGCYMDRFARTCVRCDLAISGRFFRAMERDWHPDCLACYDCGESLAGKAIYRKAGDEDGDAVYCERDFSEKHSEACAGCGKALHGQILRALDEGWHPGCFRCAECDEALDGAYFAAGNNVYCQRDHERLFSTLCGGCGEKVTGKCLRALDRTYHPACWRCKECEEPLQTDRFFQNGDDVYCEADYERLFATQCPGCQRPVAGSALHVLGQDWHKACFKCCECDRRLKRSFFQRDGRLYCQRDHSRLFDLKCAGCDGRLDGDYVDVLGFQWHRECFICTTCLKPISGGSCFVQDNKVYCAADFRALLVAAKAGAQGDAEAEGHLLAAAEEDMRHHEKAGADDDSDGGAAAAPELGRGATLPRAGGGGTRPRKQRLLVKKQRYGALTLSESARLGAKAALSRSYLAGAGAPAAPPPPGDGSAPAAAAAASSASAADAPAPARYTLAVCLSAGLAESLGAVAKRRSSRKDFKQNVEFPAAVPAGDFDFVDYCPLLFNAIRLQYGVTLDSYTQAVARRGSFRPASHPYGERGVAAEHLFSSDGRFVARTVTVAEHGFFLRFFPSYFRYLTRHRHTMLPRYFGLHKMVVPGRQKPLRVIVSNSVLDTRLVVDRLFVLKGFVRPRVQQNGALGDAEFREPLALGPEVGQCFRQQLNRDSAFLKENNVHNQAFLVGVHDVPLGAAPRAPPPFGSEALLRPLQPHPRGHARGLVSVLQGRDNGTLSTGGRHVYFFGFVDILQEWGGGKGGGGDGGEGEGGGAAASAAAAPLLRSDTRSFANLKSPARSPAHSRRFTNRLFEFLRGRVE